MKPIILVIDDEVGPRESLRILLKNDYDVYCASSSAQGVQLFKEITPDLVILDIRMPNVDGVATLKQLREIDPDVSLVMLTGYGSLETAQDAIRLGATDYIKKPFDVHEMMENVKRYVQHTRMVRRRGTTLKNLSEMNEQLKEELRHKEKMASLGISSDEFAHDLMNSLVAVLGHVQLLHRRLPKNEKVPSDTMVELMSQLDIIEKSVKRSCELARVWRNLGKVGGPPTKPVSISSILSEIQTSFDAEIKRRSVKLQIHLESQEFMILAEPTELFRAIQNVVTNSLQSVEDGHGIVNLTCMSQEDHILLLVEDNGCGIDEQHLLQIFRPYFTTRQAEGGSGLGLFITRRIVEMFKGGVHMESTPGKGSRFTFRFPLHAEARSLDPMMIPPIVTPPDRPPAFTSFML